jgi:hypothetical protein
LADPVAIGLFSHQDFQNSVSRFIGLVLHSGTDVFRTAFWKLQQRRRRMNLEKTIAVLSVSIAAGGCYELSDGSTAEVFPSEDSSLKHDKTPLSGCNPQSGEFMDANTGDTCSFNSGCGWGISTTELAARGCFGQQVACQKGRVAATEVCIVDDGEPREDVMWQDCRAMDDGRNGEACTGQFNCYRPGTDNCLEKVFCVDFDSKLARVELCSGPGAATPDRSMVHDCLGTADALPNDPCEGIFYCEGDHAQSDPNPNCASEVSPYRSTADFYCPDDFFQHCTVEDGICLSNIKGPASIIWCDGEKLHFTLDGSYPV